MIEKQSLVEVVKDISLSVYDIGRVAVARSLEWADNKLAQQCDLGDE